MGVAVFCCLVFEGLEDPRRPRTLMTGGGIMNRVRILLIVPVLLLATGTLGKAHPQDPVYQSGPRILAEFSESGIAQITTQFVDGTPVDIRVKNTPITQESFPYEPAYEEGNWAGWGAWWGPTNVAVTAVNVKVGDKAVRVSMSAYSDLASANDIVFEDTSTYSRWTRDGKEHVEISRPSFRLTIRGGDAAVSYSAQLEFLGHFLERRSVWLNEFPLEVLETTIYRTDDGF